MLLVFIYFIEIDVLISFIFSTPNRRLLSCTLYLTNLNVVHDFFSQKPDRFKLAPEMDVFVSDFLQGCEDADRQLAVMVGFSSLTNQGNPVLPSVWRVVQHLRPPAVCSVLT